MFGMLRSIRPWAMTTASIRIPSRACVFRLETSPPVVISNRSVAVPAGAMASSQPPARRLLPVVPDQPGNDV